MISDTSHKAIFIHGDGSLTTETMTETYSPGERQALIRVKYSAINPADIKHAFFMEFYKTASVAGYEWFGTVIEAGSKSPFKVGQELFGINKPGDGKKPRPFSSGAHQDFLLAEDTMTWPLPAGLDPKQAVALPVGLQTAADALLNMMGFDFEPAGLKGEFAKGKPILIWGGGSTCGHAAIQIAKHAGFHPIFTTASTKNHDRLIELGATQCFDYRDADVIQQIRDAAKTSGKQLTAAFDAVATGMGDFGAPSTTKNPDKSKSTPSQARQCLSDVPDSDLRLSAVLPVTHDSTWKFCVSIRDEGPESLGQSQDPSWPGRIEALMQWFLKNPEAFRSPNFKVVSGIDEAVKQIQRVYEGGVSMKKVVIDHPF